MSNLIKPADNGLVIINADRDGVAGHVAGHLSQMGCQIAIITMPGSALTEIGDFAIYHLPACNDDAISGLFEQIILDANQPLSGFIHIGSTVKESYNGEAGLFPKCETDILKTVFLSAKYFVQANRNERGFFISTVRMDGGLGLLTGENYIQGGLFGLHKSLAIEWEEQILTKAIDVAAELEPDVAAKYLLEEIFDHGFANIEVGRTAEGHRLAPTLVENYVDDILDHNIVLGPDDILLVTGGGRGITAECVIQLAKISGCGFILLGRTELSADISWTNGERDKTVLQHLAIAKLTDANPSEKPKPAEIDKLVNMAFHCAEVTDTLKAIKAAGGRAVYMSCDVRDSKQLRDIVEKCEKKIGAVTGFIHGAGTIADKKIQRKTAMDFDYVYGAKIEGLNACLEVLNLEKLKHLILFSSVAGYFGNGGQTDYAIANEVMNKFAFYLKKKQASCQATSINWGAWDGGSMVNESIRNIVKDSQLSLIPIEVGTMYFIEQFYEQNNPAQIIINSTNRFIRPNINNLTDIYEVSNG